MAPMGLPPGFRFHPTDEELVNYYLKRKINGLQIELDIIPEVDLYKCEPWDLSEKSFLPTADPEWYFFGPRDRKYPNGFRTNRATRAGYWKSTGKDRRVMSQARPVGMKKTLVYYRGRAPQGRRTDWVMHEYRLDDRDSDDPATAAIQDSYALCRVFKKNGMGSELEEQSGQCSNSSGAGMERSPPGLHGGADLDIMLSPEIPLGATAEEEDRDSEWMQFITPEAWCSHPNNAAYVGGGGGGEEVSHAAFMD